jgi:hypothetical protein
MAKLKEWVEFTSGVTDTPPVRIPPMIRAVLTGVWWAMLGLIIAAFCGQSSRFIYIDF